MKIEKNFFKNLIHTYHTLEKNPYKKVASDEAIDSIDIIKYKNDLPQKECPITMMEFEIDEEISKLPCGHLFNTNAINLIGNGVVIDPVIFENEISGLQKFNLDINSKLLISNRAHIILPTHKMIDASSEASKGKKKIGSTLKGIGPTYMDKTGRNGIRIGDLKSDNWTDKYNALRDKHLTILSNFKTKVETFYLFFFCQILNNLSCFPNLDFTTD